MADVVGTGVLEVDAELSRDARSKLTSDMEKASDEAGRRGGKKGSEGFGSGFKTGIAKLGIGVALGNLITSAMSSVSSSIGDAISRVDTLANFPRIMENLGFSAEEASASIGTMSTRLQGLPTALDTMTSAATRLASSPLVGSLTEATDIALGLNNAILAGGAPLEVQSAAMEQYSQAISRGSFEMEEWRSLTVAMPGQLSQVAQTMLGAGASTQDLYEAMKTGKIGIEEFNAAIVTMDQEGGAGFKSFSEQALAATGGIGTQLANLRTAVVRGLANIIEPLSPLITAALSAVQGGISGFSDAIAGGLESLDIGGLIAAALESGTSPAQIGLDIVVAIANGIVQNAPALANGITSMITGLTASLVAAVPVLVQAAVMLFSALVQALPLILPALITGFFTLINSLVPALISQVPVLVSAITTAIPLLIAALLEAIPLLLQAGLQLFGSLVTALLEALPLIITALLDMLPQVVETLLGMLPTIIQSALELFLGIVTGLLDAIPDVIVSLLDMLPQLISTLIGMIPQLIQSAVQLFTGIVEAIPKVLPKIIDALVRIGPKLVSTLIDMVPLLLQAGVDLIAGLVSGLWQAASSVGSALLKIAQDAIGDFLSFFGMHSPSRLMHGYGINTMEGYVGGIDSMRAAVDAAFQGVIPDDLRAPGISPFGGAPTGPAAAAVRGLASSGFGNAQTGAGQGDGSGTTIHVEAGAFALSGPDPRRIAIDVLDEIVEMAAA